MATHSTGTSQSPPTTSNTSQSPPPPWMEKVVVGILGGLSRLFMAHLSRTHVVGKDAFVEAVEGRAEGVGVVTVSNHVSIYDDPFTVAAAVPWSWLWDTAKLRYTLCATNRCFFHPVIGTILSWGRVLPVQRGSGIYQPYMDDVVDRLSSGDWIHIFPEGTRSVSPPAMVPLKMGVGRLVADPLVTPLVIPIVHVGMDELPGRGSIVPSVGARVTVRIGAPIAVDDLLVGIAPGEVTTWSAEDREALYKAIAKRVQAAMHVLLLETHRDHVAHMGSL